MEVQRDGGQYVVSESHHFVYILDAKAPTFPEAAIQEPDRQLRQLVELDRKAFVDADIIEARKFRYQSLNQAIAAVI